MESFIGIILQDPEVTTDWIIALASVFAVVGFWAIGITICFILDGIRRSM